MGIGPGKPNSCERGSRTVLSEGRPVAHVTESETEFVA